MSHHYCRPLHVLSAVGGVHIAPARYMLNPGRTKITNANARTPLSKLTDALSSRSAAADDFDTATRILLHGSTTTTTRRAALSYVRMQLRVWTSCVQFAKEQALPHGIPWNSGPLFHGVLWRNLGVKVAHLLQSSDNQLLHDLRSQVPTLLANTLRNATVALEEMATFSGQRNCTALRAKGKGHMLDRVAWCVLCVVSQK